MLNQVLIVFTGIQHSDEVLSKSVTFLDFWLSQGSVATYCRRGGNLCDVYIRITRWKNFENWSTFAKVIIKHQGAWFFSEHGASKQASLFAKLINKDIISMNNIQGQAARKAHKTQHCWPCLAKKI